MFENLDLYDQETFNLVGDLLCKRHPRRWTNIYLDAFAELIYIVIIFNGGGMSVRNANMNSLTENLSELINLLNGGYYEEVENYLKLKRSYYENLRILG